MVSIEGMGVRFSAVWLFVLNTDLLLELFLAANA